MWDEDIYRMHDLFSAHSFKGILSVSVYCRYVEGEAPSKQPQLLLDDSFTKVSCNCVVAN